MKNKLPLQPILVFGCRRSGTTLLRSMLAQHPDLLVHPKEPQFILTLRDRFGEVLRHKKKQSWRFANTHICQQISTQRA